MNCIDPVKKTEKCIIMRNSSLELYRILLMLLIIAHHYVYNSGVAVDFDYSTTPLLRQYALSIYGLWGKAAINGFVLISGYFLCKAELTFKKYFKLFFEILFYSVSISIIFALFDYQPLNLQILIKSLLGIFININNSFSASFMVFYAFVPLYNKIINSFSEKDLAYFIFGLLFVMTGCGTFFYAKTMNEPLWYATLYFIAAYIRFYPKKYMCNLKLNIALLITSVIMAVLICVGSIWMAHYTGNLKFVGLRSYFVIDSNKILAVLIGVSSFLVALNMPKFYNRFINIAAAGTFGVLLIHASSETMRRWLWNDILDVRGVYNNGNIYILLLHILLVPLIIYGICSFIDYFRRLLIEEPIIEKIEKIRKK